MRALIILAIAVATSGCGLSAEQRAAAAAALDAREDAQCRGYGAAPGSPAYVQCRTQLATTRAQARAALQAAAIAAPPTTCTQFGRTTSCY